MMGWRMSLRKGQQLGRCGSYNLRVAAHVLAPLSYRGEKTNELEVKTCPINTKGDTAFDQGPEKAARNTADYLTLIVSHRNPTLPSQFYYCP